MENTKPIVLIQLPSYCDGDVVNYHWGNKLKEDYHVLICIHESIKEIKIEIFR